MAIIRVRTKTYVYLKINTLKKRILGKSMKYPAIIAISAALTLSACGKEEPKPAPVPPKPAVVAPAPVQAPPTEAAKDATPATGDAAKDAPKDAAKDAPQDAKK